MEDFVREAGRLDLSIMQIGWPASCLGFLFVCLFAPCHSCSITQCFHTLSPKNNPLHKALGRNMDFIQCRDFYISKTTEGLMCKTAEGVTFKGAPNLTKSPSPQSLTGCQQDVHLSRDHFPAKPFVSWPQIFTEESYSPPPLSHSLFLFLMHCHHLTQQKKDLPTSISSYTLKGTREY